MHTNQVVPINGRIFCKKHSFPLRVRFFPFQNPYEYLSSPIVFFYFSNKWDEGFGSNVLRYRRLNSVKLLCTRLFFTRHLCLFLDDQTLQRNETFKFRKLLKKKTIDISVPKSILRLSNKFNILSQYEMCHMLFG